MTTLPLVYVTDTTFAVGDSNLFWDSPEQTQILEWCTQHGITPEAMPLDGDLVRDVDANTITYVSVEASPGSHAFTNGDKIHYRTVKQLDEPPAPWPDAVAAHIGETWLGESEHDKQIRVEERERIALAIEAACTSITEEYGCCEDCAQAAIIARQEPTS